MFEAELNLFFITRRNIPTFYTSCFSVSRYSSLDMCAIDMYDNINLVAGQNIVIVSEKMLNYPEFYVPSIKSFYNLEIPVYVMGNCPQCVKLFVTTTFEMANCLKTFVFNSICKKFLFCPSEKACMVTR